MNSVKIEFDVCALENITCGTGQTLTRILYYPTIDYAKQAKLK